MDALPDNLRIPAHLDWLGELVTRHKKTWVALGNLETRLLADKLDSIRIEKPVFVCGLARAGTTAKLMEIASQPGFTSHRYEDFPFLFTPYWWNTLLKLQPRRLKPFYERAHGDGIMINAQSPEAMEEMLWTAFFDHLHSANRSVVLDERTSNPAFESFYKNHIKKLLLVRGAKRYVAKANYNITRLRYLHKLFPDAEFIVMTRDKESHVASLMRQHARFCEAAQKSPRIARHMAQVGHFEFGPHRIPIHTGNQQEINRILDAWSKGHEKEGWEMYWEMIHAFIEEQARGLTGGANYHYLKNHYVTPSLT
jgi:hypothetical protein